MWRPRDITQIFNLKILSLSFRLIAWDPLKKLLNLGEIICELKGMVYLVLQPSWSLKEKPERFKEGKRSNPVLVQDHGLSLEDKKIIVW